MADLAASIAKARKAGYSDAEIAAYVAKDPSMGPKVAAARKAGYSDAEVVKHLGKVSVVKDVAKSGWSGLRQGMAGVMDMALSNTPVGQIGRMSPTNPFGMARPDNVTGNLFSRRAAATAHEPQTTAGEYSRTAFQMAPNAFAPGSIGARVANWALPALASEGAGQIARASGAGETGEAISRGVGALAGAGAASVRPQNAFARSRQTSPVQTLGARTRQNPDAMRARAQEMRAAGVEPTLADVVDDAGRGGIRAAANRPTPGRQAANDFSRNRSLNLPDRISTQARRTVSDDPRTPDQIRAEMARQRSTNADQAFGRVRADEVQLSPEGVQALRTDYGRDAIREAAKRERDPEVRAALNRLADAALDAPSTPISVGMADRVSRVLLSKAEQAARNGDNDLASTLGGLGRSVRGPTAEASPGYADALEGYGADTRLQQAAGVGEDLMRPNTDEFADAARALGPQERDLALASARRAVERRAGENTSAAPGVARRLADAPEQQTRNAALMGPERANAFQGAMREEARAVENASAIAPRAGSSTFLNAADDGNMVREGAGAVGDLFRGRWGSLGLRVYDAWRTRGMDDSQIEQLVRVAIDPAQTDDAIRAITARLAPQQRQEFLSLRNAALVGGLATSQSLAASPAP